jgi:hypothetical protein
MLRGQATLDSRPQMRMQVCSCGHGDGGGGTNRITEQSRYARFWGGRRTTSLPLPGLAGLAAAPAPGLAAPLAGIRVGLRTGRLEVAVDDEVHTRRKAAPAPPPPHTHTNVPRCSTQWVHFTSSERRARVGPPQRAATHERDTRVAPPSSGLPYLLHRLGC